MNKELILKAIESAKCRVYKLNFDLNGNISAHHQKKAENQKEMMEVTVAALEKQLPVKPVRVVYAPVNNPARKRSMFYCGACGKVKNVYIRMTDIAVNVEH